VKLPTIVFGLFTLLLGSVSSSFAAKFDEITASPHCTDPSTDPIEEARAAFDRAIGANEQALKERLDSLLNEEAKTDRESVELNWVRALKPWILPRNFPTRPGFVRCVAKLDSIDQKRDPVAIDEWYKCIKSLYPRARPPEFEALRKCLTATKYTPTEAAADKR
jgi:hypothetical protein